MKKPKLGIKAATWGELLATAFVFMMLLVISVIGIISKTSTLIQEQIRLTIVRAFDADVSTIIVQDLGSDDKPTIVTFCLMNDKRYQKQHTAEIRYWKIVKYDGVSVEERTTLLPASAEKGP